MGATVTATSDTITNRPTGHICTDCGESLDYVDEVWLLEVQQLRQLGGRVFHHQVFNEQDPQGDFLYDPYFYCFNCWETQHKELKEDFDDELPILDRESIMECSCCGSGIREGEYVGVITLGEFHPSTRAPNGERGPRFTSISNPDIICTFCLALLNENHMTMWEEGFSQVGECIDCTQLRCWRYNNCTCTCHTDSPDQGE